MTNPPDPGDRPTGPTDDGPADDRPTDEPTAEQNEPAPASAADAAPAPPAPAPAPPPWYGSAPPPVPAPYPFTPRVREPWVNPAKRGALTLGAIVVAFVLLAGGFGIGLAVGDDGHGNRHGDYRGGYYPGPHSRFLPDGHGQRDQRLLPGVPERPGRLPGRLPAPGQQGPTGSPTPSSAPGSATG